jgi:hypothetical protein
LHNQRLADRHPDGVHHLHGILRSNQDTRMLAIHLAYGAIHMERQSILAEEIIANLWAFVVSKMQNLYINGKPMALDTLPRLLPPLFNRIVDESQDTPEFIGEYDGVKSLPHGNYPAVYYWVDKSMNDSVRLSFNTPLLRSWCVEEAKKLGITIGQDNDMVNLAVSKLVEIKSDAFKKALAEIVKRTG